MSENETAAQGGERGKKSKYLSSAEGGVLDTSEGYQPLTAGLPEKGVFQLVGGYLDTPKDGEPRVITEVQLRAMSGHEEDLLGNTSVPFFQRMTGILSQCCERVGDYTDRRDVIRCIRGLPLGARQHLLVCLRRTTHWRATKDIYEMTFKCPVKACQKESTHRVDLASLARFEMPDPLKRVYEETLPETGITVVWKVTEADQDEIITAVVRSEKNQADLLTWGILTRLKTFDGTPVEVKVSDCVDPDTGDLLKVLPKNVLELRLAVKNLPMGDRQHLRDRFDDNEPGIDTDLDIVCPKCKTQFHSRIDMGQAGFFFPSGTRRRSKRRSFT